MHNYIDRILTKNIQKKLTTNPAVAILGPRQCGKSTLAKTIAAAKKNVLFLDLERPSDLNQLRDPELFFASNKNKLICLNEIQRAPNLFPVLRSILDENKKNNQLLMLGSASPQLLRQTSESLAGRIAYLELTPFLLSELNTTQQKNTPINQLWLKGGFPRSFLSKTNEQSFEWRLNFIRTFLEQDIPNLGIKIPSSKLNRFWRMFAHLSGQILNSAKLSSSLGTSSHTVKHYIDILQSTYMIRVLEPFIANTKKRLIKSPKIYIRDSGILHCLLNIENMNNLFAHPIYGASWEGFVIEQILSITSARNASFYRDSNGNEIDLILEHKNKRIAIECKASSSPSISKGFTTALNDLDINEAWIIAPVKKSYPFNKNITIAPINEFCNTIKS